MGAGQVRWAFTVPLVWDDFTLDHFRLVGGVVTKVSPRRIENCQVAVKSMRTTFQGVGAVVFKARAG